jgi:orotidine-5'-phosphate decarboxylase
MSSKSHLPYPTRASTHPNPLARHLFTIAHTKKSNLVLSLDVTNTHSLLAITDALGPYICVLKTHMDIISDLNATTLSTLRGLSTKHNFLIFEDRKFVDIGSTVQKQYHGGLLQISSWAHIVNCAVLAGPGIVDSLAKIARQKRSEFDGERGLLILAEMTSKGSLATGTYTTASVDIARQHPDFVMGFVATKSLSFIKTDTGASEQEDFVVFTTGVNLESKGDSLGQQYQTPKSAVQGGADFIIAGRGIYEAADPVEACRRYQKEGWEAYLERVGGKE